MEAAPVQNRTGTLAQLFQEPLTVVARLRAQRQNVQDAGTFREQFRTLLTSAAQQARGSHSTEDIRKATFAVVGFLDESVLNSGLAAFSNWAQAQVGKPEMRGLRVESLETGRPEMRMTLDRAEKFLNLVALLSALLSAVAVALAARGFAAAHLDDCAMLRVLGQPQRTIA